MVGYCHNNKFNKSFSVHLYYTKSVMKIKLQYYEAFSLCHCEPLKNFDLFIIPGEAISVTLILNLPC